MNPISIFMLGMAMSTDAFAAALGKGAGMYKPQFKDALRIGLIFGLVETLTPVIGWLLGSVASQYIKSFDHWIAFVLLVMLGGNMIYKSISCKESAEEKRTGKNGFFAIALTGVATSIDAMAIGVGLAFIDVNITVIAVVIGLCTFVMVTVGVMMGRMLGAVVGKRAEMIGGIILILVGATILCDHLISASGN